MQENIYCKIILEDLNLITLVNFSCVNLIKNTHVHVITF